MKTQSLLGALALVAVLLFCALPVRAQNQQPFQDFVAAGISWNQYSNPQISGALFYAHQIPGNLYSFNAVDIVSKTIRPFTVTTTITTGLAQKLRDIGPARVYICATIGVGAGGSNVGSAYSAGGAAIIPIGKRGWSLMPNLRMLKTSLSEFQGQWGLAVGWGK